MLTQNIIGLSVEKFQKPKKNKIKLGQIFSLKINALGPKQSIGLVEFQNGLTVLVPNAGLGDLVKVRLEKVLNSRNSSDLIKKRVVLASLIETIRRGKISENQDLFIGKKISLIIKRKGPKNSGLGFFSNDFPIIVPINSLASKITEVRDNNLITTPLLVKITKLKSNYAFAQKIKESNLLYNRLELFNREIEFILPLNAISLGNFFVLKSPINRQSNQSNQSNNRIVPTYDPILNNLLGNNKFLFVQKSLGIKGGDTIIVKIYNRKNFLVGKVVKVGSYKIGPIGLNRTKKVKFLVQKMMQSCMHYGERAIKCNANMRSYLWLRKKGSKNLLIDSKKPLLKRGRHILNLFKTYKSLKKSLLQLSKYAISNHSFLFVGTKKSASSLIARTAILVQTAFFVNNRWLGGMLTNWKTILKSLSQMKPILKEKQRVTQNILFSRQKIKDRLLFRVNILRKKSKKLISFANNVLKELQQNPINSRFVEKNEFLLKLTNKILLGHKNLLFNFSSLHMKEQKIFVLLNSLKSHFHLLIKQKTYLKVQTLNIQKEIHELKQLFFIGQKMAQLQNSMLDSGKMLFSLPYSLLQSSDSYIPNPSVNILNQMIATIAQKSNFKYFITNQSKNIKPPILIGRLLEKFSIYLPFMKKYFILTYQRLVKISKILKLIKQNMDFIKTKFQLFLFLSLEIISALKILKSKLLLQKKYLKALKVKLIKYLISQKLLKFLPKLRYLPTTKTKMYQRVELLMKKFVDPKMSYVIDQIYDQKFQSTSKKMANNNKQKWQRLEKYFGGVTQMAKMSLKHNNLVAIIIGQQEEMNAVRECQKLGIKMFTVVDTNCNPQFSDYIIPANDDSSTSILYILGQIFTYIRLAQKIKRKI